MNRLLLGLITVSGLFFLGAEAHAKLVRIPIEPSLQKKYANILVTRGTRQYLIGEYEPKPNPQSKRVRFFSIAPSDPASVPYVLDNEGQLLLNDKGQLVKPRGFKPWQVVEFEKKDVDTGILKPEAISESETLQSLADEYTRRRQLIESKMGSKTSTGRSSPSSAEATKADVLPEYQQLRHWLRTIGFLGAQESVDGEIAKLLSSPGKSAAPQVTEVPTPPDLEAVNQELSGGKLKFQIYETQHIRLVSIARQLDPKKIQELLQLGEEAIRRFRERFVTPYIGSEFPDTLGPVLEADGKFMEYWFGDGNVQHYEQFLEKYYAAQGGMEAWSQDEDHRRFSLSLDAAKRRGYRLSDHTVDYLYYAKSLEGLDLESAILHPLGHSLFNAHFNANELTSPVAWLNEGFGYFLSFDLIHRNNVSCKSFEKREYSSERGYGERKTGETEQVKKFKDLAKSGNPLRVLGTLDMDQLSEADVAKAWSLVDYLLAEEGLTGQIWIRETARAAREACNQLRATRFSNAAKQFVPDWTETTAQTFRLPPSSAFTEVDDLWAASLGRRK